MTELNKTARIAAPRASDDLEWSPRDWLRRVARKNSGERLLPKVDDGEKLRVAADTA